MKDAPPLANVGALKTDAQGVVANFARDMLAIAKLQKVPVVGPPGLLPIWNAK